MIQTSALMIFLSTLRVYILSEFISFIALIFIATPTSSSATAVDNLPPIDTLIDSTNTTIIGDISFLLDFAIIAFPKAGTTFLKDYIHNGTAGSSDSDDREVYVYPHELCMKRTSNVIDFVYKFYELHLQYNQQYDIKRPVKFGIKCPGVFYRPNDIHIYKKYFPHAKLIIGLRHPISWLESFYNYQLWRNVTAMPQNTTQLIGQCNKHQKVCTDRARFHAALARLGKTELVEDEELSLLYGFNVSSSTASSEEDVGSTTLSSTQQLRGRRLTNDDQQVQPRSRHQQQQQQQQQQRGLPNEVLLYEINQIHNSQTSTAFSKSIQQYLSIQYDLPQIQHYQQTKVRAINICDTQHDNVRKVLLDHGKYASKWIQTYFLSNPSVNIVDETSFYKLMNDWNVDPCLE